MFRITASGKLCFKCNPVCMSGFQARQRNTRETTAQQVKGIFSDNASSHRSQRASGRYLNVLAVRGGLALACGG